MNVSYFDRQGLITGLVQCFFARRVRIIMGRSWAFVIIWILAILQVCERLSMR